MFIDLPLDELAAYRGTNPRPADFDAYWAAALAELDTVDPDPQLTPAGFTTDAADCHDLWFTGVRGARIHAKLLRPKTADRPGPALLLFHGYSQNAGDWSSKLGYIAAGFTVAALDCRGQGGLSQDTGGHLGTTLQGHIVRGLDGPVEDMLFRQIFLDTVQLARVVAALPGVDPDRMGAMGASQGGALTLACAALEPRIRRAVAGMPFPQRLPAGVGDGPGGRGVCRVGDLLSSIRPPASAPNSYLRAAGLHRRPPPGPAHPGRGADEHRSDGRHLPAVNPVRGL